MPEMAHDWINKSILFFSNYAKIMGKKKKYNFMLIFCFVYLNLSMVQHV